MPEIKKCPFCGGPAEIRKTFNERHQYYYTQVRCTLCYGSGPSARTSYDPNMTDQEDPALLRAIGRWNRRTEGFYNEN